jgi:uncharacterized protein
MKLLRTELSSEFKDKFFDMSAKELPNRGTNFGDDHISCELSVKTVQFGFQISGELKASPEYKCVRCLVANTTSLTLPFNLWLSFQEDVSSEEQDVVFFPESQDTFELNDPIADLISLAEPMNPICNNNCKGLCSICGTNLNQNPCDCIINENDNPWDALKNFKPK